MTLDELKTCWISQSQPELQARIWNRASDEYAAKPLPDLQKDDFLRRMAEELPFHSSLRILDIGCGAGGYTLALAPVVGEAVGVDISDGMIDIANHRKTELGAENTLFTCLNWADADIDRLGYRKKFDIVFAHMTPAVDDYSTLDKMDACSRCLCMLQKPTRRKDSVLDRVMEMVNIRPSPSDNGIINIFTYLWNKGYAPQFVYHNEVWNTSRSTENMIGWCTDRASLRKELSCEEKETIRSFVEGLAENGFVKECTTTTRVTILWKKEK